MFPVHTKTIDSFFRASLMEDSLADQTRRARCVNLAPDQIGQLTTICNPYRHRPYAVTTGICEPGVCVVRVR